MAENKTKANEASVDDYLDSIDDESKREDSRILMEILARASGEPPVMWSGSIVGFGRYHYKYDSGREGEHMLTGFAPRKAQISVYIMPGFEPYKEQLERLGKHKTAKSCLYIKRLSDVDLGVLEEIATDSVIRMRKAYPDS
ncbi:MAG: DUF1801 domain-containing protein [Pseudomonadota bacterium]